jgi:hypothetical protein
LALPSDTDPVTMVTSGSLVVSVAESPSAAPVPKFLKYASRSKVSPAWIRPSPLPSGGKSSTSRRVSCIRGACTTFRITSVHVATPVDTNVKGSTAPSGADAGVEKYTCLVEVLVTPEEADE